MALFLDGPAVTIDDLQLEDSELLQTAQTVNINVTAKLGLAMSQVQSELETLLLRPQSVLTAGPIQQPKVAQVVVTRDLARWEKMLALSMVYRDASFTQLVDRYKSKWDMFVALTQAARDQFIASGIGLVADPVPAAALPVLGTVSTTTTQNGGMFYACVTWLNKAGQEGAPSEIASLAVPAQNLMTVMPSQPAKNAVGFNVYVGTVLAQLTLQNTTGAIAPGSTFTYLPGASTSSQVPGTGQAPDYVKALPAITMRG